MRILFVNARPNAAELPGGDSIQLEKTRQALLDLGVTIDVCQPEELGNLGNYDLAHVFNIQMPDTTWQVVQTLAKKGLPYVLSPIYWDMYEYWAEEALHSLNSWKRMAKMVGLERARRLYINWQYKKAPLKRDWRLQRKLLQAAQRVLPNSASEVDHLQSSFLMGSDFQNKVDIIPNAIDTDLYQRLPEPSQAFIDQYGLHDFVLEVGTIYPVKNQLGLIKAMEGIPVPIVFIGQVMDAYRDYAQTCEQSARRHGQFLFLDRVDHNLLKNIYALAAVHVLPSWRETPGLVSLEAAAAGCNIVSTSIGSTRDYFGDQAMYCHPADLASIRSAVVAALATKPDGKLRQRVLSEYTWQCAAQATLGSYQKALHAN